MHISEHKLKVVIAGGGTAGWLTAAAFARQLGTSVDVTLVESTEIGTVGVGEATIPPMRTFHRLLKIDEQQFMKATNATFKLGIQFENWRVQGENYFHSFGTTGKETIITEFLHFWLKGREMGIAKEFGDYCVEFKAALEGKFAIQAESKINYAFHLDAALYAKFLKDIALAGGVKHQDCKINGVKLHESTGFIRALELEGGDELAGDIFIDCTGMRGLLIEQALHTGFEDWSHWLPCDTAVAVQTLSTEPAVPYTRSIAHHAGWRWKIPLQNRTGNGLVFCSRHMNDSEATQLLRDSVQGELITEPRVIRFRTGRRRKVWNKNCVAIGLSSGFLEPLESTSIHLVMTAITRLLQMFPQKEISQSVVNEFNRQSLAEIERIRDFIILHYKVTERSDSAFWRHCRDMEIPEELAHRIRLFKETGKSYQVEGELFRLDSWTQVMLGQGLYPEQYHPIVDSMKTNDLNNFLRGLHDQVSRLVDKLPRHDDFVREYCGI